MWSKVSALVTPIAELLNPAATPTAPTPTPTPTRQAPVEFQPAHVLPLDNPTARVEDVERSTTADDARRLDALLDEAELYLLPRWADPNQAARLLDEAAPLAPDHPRLRELQNRLGLLRNSAGSVDAWLAEAEQHIAAGDYWGAAALYERVLQQQQHEAALSGLERARMLGRWSALRSGAADDPRRLQSLADEYQAVAPDLAVEAYEAAFTVRPTIIALRGWLLALGHSGQVSRLAECAQTGAHLLYDAHRIGDNSMAVNAVRTLQQEIASTGPEQIDEAIGLFIETLVAATRTE